MSSSDTETSKNSQNHSTSPTKAARLGAFLETYRLLLLSAGAPDVRTAWREARTMARGVGEDACREAVRLHGLPLPPERSHRRGRALDPDITAFRETYEWALRDLADLYGLPLEDPDITRAAWHAAMQSHPVGPSSARMRCRHDGLPLPRPGRPAATVSDLPPLPPVVCKRRGIAMFDSAWVAREGLHLGPTHTPPAEFTAVRRLDAAQRHAARVQELVRNRRRAIGWRQALSTVEPQLRGTLVARLEKLAGSRPSAHAH